MDKADITAAIETKVNGRHSIWTVGITQDPERRKSEHEAEKESTTYWKQWEADSLSDAQDIERHFLNDKHMKGGTGGDMSSHRTTYVYVF